MLALLPLCAQAVTMRSDISTALETLALRPPFTSVAVKAAFRRRAAESHPDRAGSAEEFMRVTAAYELLQRPSVQHIVCSWPSSNEHVACAGGRGNARQPPVSSAWGGTGCGGARHSERVDAWGEYWQAVLSLSRNDAALERVLAKVAAVCSPSLKTLSQSRLYLTPRLRRVGDRRGGGRVRAAGGAAALRARAHRALRRDSTRRAETAERRAAAATLSARGPFSTSQNPCQGRAARQQAPPKRRVPWRHGRCKPRKMTSVDSPWRLTVGWACTRTRTPCGAAPSPARPGPRPRTPKWKTAHAVKL